MGFETTRPGRKVDVIAPDGSEIRLLARLAGGSFVHCRLPPGGVSLAVRHRQVEEVWYFLGGTGEVWRALDGEESVVTVTPGTALTIPVGTRFQFRNTGEGPLEFVLVTMPPWPGAEEAVRVPDFWPVEG
jgi:mannose-6-phosphate isomerase-like protein (cupin superfamily)